MRIRFRKEALKKLKAMQPTQSRAILDNLEKLAETPSRVDLDVRPLAGRPGYRSRVGKWRVIYRIADDALLVERIAPRGKVYKS